MVVVVVIVLYLYVTQYSSCQVTVCPLNTDRNKKPSKTLPLVKCALIRIFPYYFCFLLCSKELQKDVETRQKSLNTRGEQVSGKLKKVEQKEFMDRLRTLNEEWQKAKDQLDEQRKHLEDGISSCMKHLDMLEQAKSKAKEIDGLLDEINSTTEADISALESKTQVIYTSEIY